MLKKNTTEVERPIKEFKNYEWEGWGNIDYNKDTERYEAHLGYCGYCKYALKPEISYDEKDRASGGIFTCETCESEYEGVDMGEGFNPPRFCIDCPCYCYLCIECESNVMETTKEDDEDCEYGDHTDKRKRLLRRLGETDEIEEEEYYYVEMDKNWPDWNIDPKKVKKCVFGDKLLGEDTASFNGIAYLFYPHENRKDFGFSERFVVCENHYKKCEKNPNYNLWEFRESYLKDDNKDWDEKEINNLLKAFREGKDFIVKVKRGEK